MPDTDLIDLGPLMLGGAPASAALRELEPLAARLIAHFADTNPIFARFEMADVQEDLVAVIAVGLRLATRLMDERRVPVDSDLDCVRALTVKQALKGVPLDAILKLSDEGIAMFRTLILNGAGSDDSADLVELNRLIFALAQQLHRLVSVSYLEVVPSAARAAGESTGLLFKAVIAGEDPADVAMQLGLDLAPAHLVLRLSVSPHPQRRAGHGGQSQHAQEHRILAAVLGRLAAHHGAALLAAPATHQGLVLIAGNPTWASVCAIVKRIEAELGIAITAVGEQADLAATTAATVNTRELEHLVRRLGLKPGTYRMEDLAMEYQLTRGSPGRDTFVRILAPLENYPDLLETLAVHLANEKNRQRTATMLGLHANTVDNRLRRIAQLTGVDPMQPSGLATLHAAMIVAEFTQAS